MDTIVIVLVLAGLAVLSEFQRRMGNKLLVAMLDKIHLLVNSNLTTVMQSELNSLQGQLILMRRVEAVPGETVVDPSVETIEARISELSAQLNDRYKTADREAAQ